MLRSAESQVPKLISREIIFAELQRVWSQSTNVPDGRSDGQTGKQLIMAIPRYATLRAVKTVECLIYVTVHCSLCHGFHSSDHEGRRSLCKPIYPRQRRLRFGLSFSRSCIVQVLHFQSPRMAPLKLSARRRLCLGYIGLFLPHSSEMST